VIVYHVAVTTADDYVTRREPHRRAHLERLLGLRAASICIGGGPGPDGRGADLFYRLQQPGQLKHAIEEDPYWTAGAWTAYAPRSFSQFVEPWQQVDLVTDGSRRVTTVEGAPTDHATAQLALVELRGAGRVVFGGFFEDGDTLAVTTAADPDDALGWFVETGLWERAHLRARPFLHVL
jgi:uncharacterized protein